MTEKEIYSISHAVKNYREKIARVALFTGIDKDFYYIVPENIISLSSVGSIVKVPIKNFYTEGVILEFLENIESKFELKRILSIIQPEKVLTEDLIKLLFWMKKYYSTGLQSILETMIPSIVRKGGNPLSQKEIFINKVLSSEEYETLKKRAKSQAKLYSYMLASNHPISKSALIKISGASDSSINGLIEKNILSERDKILNRSTYDDELSSAEMVSSLDHILNDEQKIAFENISKILDDGKFSTHLLYGVTGSGKTEVYIKSIKKVLADGGSCIFLVPEISLTPQTVGRLRSRLKQCGTELVVWHSGLSDGQRLDAWRALSSGRARIVVGARSCIFAPLKNLKLIIVDEEHDSAYKQDKTPRYSARDVAVMRAKLSDSLCILGSATPSLETIYNAKEKKYSISRITKRIDGSKLPKIFVIDMKYEKRGSLLSNMLVDKLILCKERGEQAILFLNRRGYSKILECEDCGEVEECPHCSISMTWHKDDNSVKCHLCGYKKSAPSSCKQCGSKNIKWKSFGTQKIEEIVRSILPNAKIGRMDADTMKRKDNYRKILGDFRLGKLDILIGTQMIAKGLDFPKVTLVGIINADIGLHMPDFRANERTYQLIVQVAGRAGRSSDEGEVIVQTMNPDASPIIYAKSGDLDSFLEEELALRTKHNYPPNRRIIRHIFKSRNLEKLEFYTDKWVEFIEKYLPENCEIKGPSSAPIEKIETFYRFHILYFTNAIISTLEKISEARSKFPMDEDISDTLDTDPQDLM